MNFSSLKLNLRKKLALIDLISDNSAQLAHPNPCIVHIMSTLEQNLNHLIGYLIYKAQRGPNQNDLKPSTRFWMNSHKFWHRS